MGEARKARVLVTGATGFLGSHLVRALVAGGMAVTILKRSSSDCWRLKDVLPCVRSYDTDVSPVEAAFAQAPPYDAVFHAAAIYGRHGESDVQVMESNLLFSLEVLEAAARHGAKRFLHADTSGSRFLNAYALSKRQFAEWGRLAAREGGIAFYDVQLEHMYGPQDDASKFVEFLVRQCRSGVPELDLTAGEQRRDFIHVDDVVSACLLLAGCEAAGYREFGLGSGETVRIRELAELVRRLTGAATRLNFGAVPYRANETMASQADISGLLRLGWRPRVGLEEGIRRLLEDAGK